MARAGDTCGSLTTQYRPSQTREPSVELAPICGDERSGVPSLNGPNCPDVPHRYEMGHQWSTPGQDSQTAAPPSVRARARSPKSLLGEIAGYETVSRPMPPRMEYDG